MKNIQKLEKEIEKVRGQIINLQKKLKTLEEQKLMAERAEKIDFIEKNHISSEQLQMLIQFEKEELKRILAQKESAENETKIIN